MKLYSVAILAFDPQEFVLAMTALADTPEDALSQCYKRMAANGDTWQHCVHSVCEVPEQFVRAASEEMI